MVTATSGSHTASCAVQVVASPSKVTLSSTKVELGAGETLQLTASIEPRDAIDRMLDRILPVMRERGGYIPTCDHGVPEEVKLSDYIYMRKRMLEWA